MDISGLEGGKRLLDSISWILAALAEFERGRLRELVLAGLARARAQASDSADTATPD